MLEAAQSQWLGGAYSLFDHLAARGWRTRNAFILAGRCLFAPGITDALIPDAVNDLDPPPYD